MGHLMDSHRACRNLGGTECSGEDLAHKRTRIAECDLIYYPSWAVQSARTGGDTGHNEQGLDLIYLLGWDYGKLRQYNSRSKESNMRMSRGNNSLPGDA
jgi:hypothetical protein